MLETTTSGLLEEEAELTVTAAPRLTISGVTFNEGRLCQPRYPKFFAYSREIENLQFEPAFQIIAPAKDLEIDVLFEIQADQGVWFASEVGDPGTVRCRAIDDPTTNNVAGLVSAAFDGDDRRRCLLRWKRSELSSKVTTIRIFCERSVPSTDPWDLVEGGLYLSVIDRPREPAELTPAFKVSPRADATVKIVGVDRYGRAIYDLFQPTPGGLPPALELEPAVRSREGDEHTFALELDLPDPYSSLAFATVSPGKARVTYLKPPERPRQLVTTDTKPGDKVCDLVWRQGYERSVCRTDEPGSRTPLCTRGATATFFFETAAGPGALNAAHRLAEVLEIDPTVIQPPVCTSDGVCLPPPNGKYSAA